MVDSRWSDKYSVGDAAIDADHKGLFALINALRRADRAAIDVVGIIAKLEDYAAGHFAREEELMKKVGYPGLTQHAEEHERFVEWIDTVKRTYARAAESPFLIGDMVNDFLIEWLANHIMTEDMKYRDFIVKK